MAQKSPGNWPDRHRGNRPDRQFVGYVEQLRIFPRLPKAVVGGVFRSDPQEIVLLRCTVEEIFLRLWDRHPEDRDTGMPALVGICRGVTDLRIEQIGLRRVVLAICRSIRIKTRVASVNQLLAVNNLKDAGTGHSIGKVHPIVVQAPGVHLMNHFRIAGPGGIGDPFVARTVDPGRIVVTALRRGGRSRAVDQPAPTGE